MPVITGRGINQGDLVTLLQLIRTNFVGVTAKLDLDSGVTDTNYASTLDFSFPVTISNAGIFSQGSVLDYLTTVETQFNALLAKLDADTAVTDTDYESTWAVTDRIDSPTTGSLLQAGVYEGALVKWLDAYLTNWNGALAKMDADLGDTDYVSLWGITAANYVDATGCVHKP